MFCSCWEVICIRKNHDLGQSTVNEIPKGESVMGISIHLSISKSVTQEEWEQVYKETLCLVEKFSLAEKRKVPIHGIDTFCMV